jgi:hypothetical protein
LAFSNCNTNPKIAELPSTLLLVSLHGSRDITAPGICSSEHVSQHLRTLNTGRATVRSAQRQSSTREQKLSPHLAYDLSFSEHASQHLELLTQVEQNRTTDQRPSAQLAFDVGFSEHASQHLRTVNTDRATATHKKETKATSAPGI